MNSLENHHCGIARQDATCDAASAIGATRHRLFSEYVNFPKFKAFSRWFVMFALASDS